MITAESTRLLRTILLAAVVLLLGLTAYLYVRTGEIDLGSSVVALGCLVIFIVTKPRQTTKEP